MQPTVPSTKRSSRLAGHYTLVTGAAQGIGRAIAVRFAEEGAHVAVNFGGPSSSGDETLALVQAASAAHGHGARDHITVKADIGVEADIAGMFETVLARWPRLDCLVNNAGFQRESPSESLDVETYRAILEVNLNGAVLCARHALAHFVARNGGGNIINTSSVHQIIPKPGYLAYSISKSAMAGLTRTLALEFAGRGIRVNSVGPGAVDTPINAAWTDDPAKRAAVESHIPLGRVATPDEIAGVFAFLASSEASYITGQTIYACGGITLFGEFRDNWAS
ncbi:glucose-1-dehydrogenase [Bradyrhizobium sp. SSBR45G]|uniref:SDR family oxidoreductase n=1 Tax=unclassified Bradyrhizobium TaxID=2631580 RepID=UPI002342BAD5|nr:MULTISPECIES: SDR family oxidoreductase [unclassified Bradyrhizobium]GLH80274.1 glucose-1-dehydrogenase [Bradyrhizobium sp. SSBR45G]GLH87768.1 glucose-1-dehydrogenase [Bradyrhizobium sp. SSBR45R]